MMATVGYPPVDDDVAAGVVTKWNGDLTLPTLVPGGLQRGRLSSFQPNAAPPRTERQRPYAVLAVAKGAEGNHTTGGWYMDTRAATIEVYGLEAEVRGVLAYLRGVNGGPIFNRQSLTTSAPLVGVMQQDTDEIKEDPNTKKGEDWWIGSTILHVCTMRPE